MVGNSNETPLEHDDYSNIFKTVHLKPEEWLELQRIWEGRVHEKLHQTGQLNVFSCLCRSPWCPTCGKTCKTAETIRERLQMMQWDKTRQVVLTVNRSEPPHKTFKTIRESRSIPKMIKRLGLSEHKWLWVLEFHKGGYPHWHLFIETTRGSSGMIGKKAVQKVWKHGLVWETYAKSDEHWKAITGYHRKTGYFAAETKQHQLELPDYLQESNRVRKFASNFITKKEREIADAKKENRKANEGQVFHVKQPRRNQKPYRERIKGCNTTSKVRKGKAWIDISLPGKEVRELARQTLDEIDYKTFQGSKDEVIELISKLPG